MFLDIVSWRKKKSSLYLAATWEPTMPQTNNRDGKWRSWWVSSGLFCPCGLERWWSSHKVGVHKEKLPSLFLSLLELERGGDLLVDSPSQCSHHTSSKHSWGQAFSKPAHPPFPVMSSWLSKTKIIDKHVGINNLLEIRLTCRWRRQLKRLFALFQAASVSSPRPPAEKVQIWATL